MKYRLVLILLLIWAGSVNAQDNKLLFQGEFMTDQRIRTVGGLKWGWNENRLNLKLENKLVDKARFQTNIWFRSFGFPAVEISNQLYDNNLISPYRIDFREGYAEFYNFLVPNLDLRIGRQKFSWGKADRINPTNNLNPLDLEDIWDFGRVAGSDAIRLNYYIKDFKIEGIWLPFFRPATLPAGDWAEIFHPQIELPPGMSLGSYADSVILPSLTFLQSSNYGFKLSGRLLDFDWSGSYVYGYDPLPVSQRNVISLTNPGQINILAKMGYIRQHIAGVDFSGQIGNIGIWGEAALFKATAPVIMITDLSAFGLPDMDSVLLDDKPFVKFIIGGDYTFRDASYLHIQYLHGFFHERGKSEMKDYFFLNYRKKTGADKIQLELISGAFVVGNWHDLRNNYALIYHPSISYFVNDNSEISLG
ncbi:MAG: hypothetical protein H8E61_02380, partial [Bacteroidetes bacterium]|nr:hypothetical protein [Bacteroidota bacterium]